MLKIKTIETAQLSKEEIKKCSNEIRYLTTSAWGDPAELADRWLELADVVVLARDADKLVAFASGKIIDNKTLNLVATIIDPSYQGKGLSTKLNLEIAWYFIEKHPIQFMEGFNIVFRTQNPSLYEKVYKKIPIFPDYRKNIEPTVQQRAIFKRIIQLFCPRNEFDEDKFVIKKAHDLYPGLIYDHNNIPWAKSIAINHFFEKRLKYDRKSGDTMVFIGYVKPFHLLKYDLIKSIRYFFSKNGK